MQHIGPTVGALIFIALMSFVPMPERRTVNALIVAGAAGAYISGGGFGAWELAYVAPGLALAYLGLRRTPFIGVAWLLHSAWDWAHHVVGSPIWPFLPDSSRGCMIFDAGIGLWFLLGAPGIGPQGAEQARRSRQERGATSSASNVIS